MRLAITHFTATSCLGTGLEATRQALHAQRSGLAPCRFDTVDFATFAGEVPGVDALGLPEPLADFDCRNNRLALLALRQDGMIEALHDCVRRHGAARIGVFLGTSTSGILQTELAYRRRDPADGALPPDFHYDSTHNSFALADFVRRLLGLEGPAAVVCCACASSAKVFAQAQRMLAVGLIDAALVGGVDSLCLTTLYGFHSLQLTSATACRPFDTARDGISIGEAAAFLLLERDTTHPAGLRLLGSGESSDAHHMSSPHPDGLGAQIAMRAALAMAGLDAAQIDYVNLHGTGTPGNDRAESRAVNAVFDARTVCSSTKGATGHTLGAAGALEAVISLLALRDGLVPAGLNAVHVDPELQLRYALRNERRPLRHVLSNSFGFGGANCSLVFGRDMP